jgi:hypothetical protein
MLLRILIASLLFFSAAQAAEIDRMGLMTCKIKVEHHDHTYFTLSDGSCWKAFPFTKRWRSPLEWWRGVNLEVPEAYECLPNDWVVGADIEAYPKYDALSVDETHASNAEELKRCTHLLVNRHTRQILFAVALQPGDCLKQVFDEAYQQGLAKGQVSGYSDGYRDGRERRAPAEPPRVYIPQPPSAPPLAYADPIPLAETVPLEETVPFAEAWFVE